MTLLSSPLQRSVKSSPQVLFYLSGVGCESGGASIRMISDMCLAVMVTWSMFWLCCARAHTTCLRRSCETFVLCSIGKPLTMLVKDASYFASLLCLSLMRDSLNCMLIPHLDELLLYARARMDPFLAEESLVLFSSQFWVEGDIVCSSSTELLDQKATIVAVDLDQQSVTLLLDDQTYHCPLLEQHHVFYLGDHL